MLFERDFTPVLKRARGDFRFRRMDQDVDGSGGIAHRLRHPPGSGHVEGKRELAVTRTDGLRIHEDVAVGVKTLRAVPHFGHAVG